jgi:hypothetical protein
MNRVDSNWTVGSILCDSWTSHDDVGGEGEQTFYHECGGELGHAGRHTCFGHRSDWDDAWESCWQTWGG